MAMEKIAPQKIPLQVPQTLTGRSEMKEHGLLRMSPTVTDEDTDGVG